MNDPALEEIVYKLEATAIELFFAPESDFKTRTLALTGLTFVRHNFELEKIGREVGKVYFKHRYFNDSIISMVCEIFNEGKKNGDLRIRLNCYYPRTLTFEEHEEPKVILTLEGLSKKVIELEKQVKYQREEIDYLKSKL